MDDKKVKSALSLMDKIVFFPKYLALTNSELFFFLSPAFTTFAVENGTRICDSGA